MDAVEQAIAAFKKEAQRIYGDRFDRVVLFGSHARGEATAASDVDLLLVLEGEVQAFEELDRLSEITWEIDMEHDVLLNVVPISAGRYRHGQSPFLINARREGTPA